MISVSTTSTAIIVNYIGTLFSDLGVIIALVIGLPLGFWVINKVIGLVKTRIKK